MKPIYQPQQFEEKWQLEWEARGIYRAEENPAKPKYYCLNFFPYPSGDGLHVGHCRNYIPTDLIARYKRMQGFNVLHPMGWDAFGEPTEQHAVRHGIHPRESTDRNTAHFKHQMGMLGLSYDWGREIDSSHPSFYRWTQWFFTLLYERGLAYRDTNWQWWCPTCQTTMSSHEAAGGICWRGHDGLTKREIPAWYFRITAYAEALLAGLENIDWPEPIKAMQRHWIGKSEGAEIDFQTSSGDPIQVFTTRAETVFGATFLVLAPEHPGVGALTTPAQASHVEGYIAKAIGQSEIERTADDEEKTGVFTGSYAANPVTGDQVPIWVGSYVLPRYGAGAVMGVPAHDPRDFAFAKRYHLPVRVVVAPPDHTGSDLAAAYEGAGTVVNAGRFSGMPNMDAAAAIVGWMAEEGWGRSKIQYRMRDWLISRQRYWGTPIPIVYCDDCGEVPVPVEALPVTLPPMDDFMPDGSGRSPLARMETFVHTSCPTCAGPARRETDTMGGFACSSWYFLHFTSPDYDDGPFDPEAMNYWMPADLYVGGAEHAVLHLLYSRFWTRVLADIGLVPFKEPFQKLVNQGILHGPDGKRMSKQAGNVITPDQVIAEHGADALRVFELFIAPFDQDVNWTTDGMAGAWRFLARVWSMTLTTYPKASASEAADPVLERLTHRTIRMATERIETFRFNTLISLLMEFVNALQSYVQASAWQTRTFATALETLLLLLAPAAPHLAEELWSRTGRSGSIHTQSWPGWDPALAHEAEIQLAVQINGKVRTVIQIQADASETTALELALGASQIIQNIGKRKIQKTIYVPGKILNLLVE